MVTVPPGAPVYSVYTDPNGMTVNVPANSLGAEAAGELVAEGTVLAS